MSIETQIPHPSKESAQEPRVVDDGGPQTEVIDAHGIDPIPVKTHKEDFLGYSVLASQPYTNPDGHDFREVNTAELEQLLAGVEAGEQAQSASAQEPEVTIEEIPTRAVHRRDRYSSAAGAKEHRDRALGKTVFYGKPH